MRLYSQPQVIFNAKASTGTGNSFLASDWQHLILTLSSDTHATFTIKFQASDSQDSPDFSAAQSPTNEWDYVQVKDLQNNAAIDGDTGISFADDDLRRLEVNTNGCRWLAATITAYTDGNVYLKVTGYNQN